jgi:hypothetical protein
VDAINVLANLALPTAFGAPAVPLQPGQVVQALVLQLIQSDVFRLQLPQAVVDVRTDVALTPGSTITLAAKGTGSALKLEILGQGNPALGNATTGSAAPRGAPAILAPDVAARAVQQRPLGEAVIVGRVNVPDAKPAAPAVAAPAAAPPEATPERALIEAVRTAAARQGGAAPLFADAEQAATLATLPAPVRAAVTQLLGLRVPLDQNLTAAGLKQAFTRSGVLLEPTLAAATQSPPNSTAPAVPDLKAALLVLRQVVKAWAAEAPQSTPAPASTPGPASTPAPAPASTSAPVARPAPAATSVATTVATTATVDATIRAALDPLAALPASASPPLSPEEAESMAKSVATGLLAKAPVSPLQPQATPAPINPPPPYRGAPLTAQPPTPTAIAEDLAPRAVADRLVAVTDAALSRQTLLQAASLPDMPGFDAPRDSGPRWTFEVPFATPQGTAILPFEIARDGRGASADPQAAPWRARFSLDLEPMGPVHALVTLAGDRASVTLWAERISTASKLNDNVAMLGDALRAAELQPSELAFRVGTPRAAKAAAPGRFMDRAS